LRGYLKICKEVKERRLQLFKDYFVEERKWVSLFLRYLDSWLMISNNLVN
jgi:hypothetical protein